MPAPVPSIDQNPCLQWNEQERDMYNSLPFFFAKYEVAYRKTWATHSKLVGKMSWRPNEGPIMRGVRKERSPHIRQEAMPNELCGIPKKDIVDVQEVVVNATLKRQRFESRIISWCASFTDFMKDHINPTMEDMAEKITRFEDIFVRTGIFHGSPFVWVSDRAPANGEAQLVTSPRWDGQAMNVIADSGKNVAWRQQLAAQVGNPGNLSLCQLFKALGTMQEDLRVPAWNGGDGIPKDNSPLSGKFVLVTSSEAFNQFIHDPFIQANKNCAYDIIHEGFRGNLWGQITIKIEDLPLRMKTDGTFPAPETREINPAAYNENETVANPDYINAPYEWAFLYGREGYKSLQVGPPPAAFVGKTQPKGWRDMFWNGEIRLTKDFLVPCMNEDNVLQQESNTYGEFLKLISQTALGIIPTQPRNVVPILFKRIRGC